MTISHLFSPKRLLFIVLLASLSCSQATAMKRSADELFATDYDFDRILECLNAKKARKEAKNDAINPKVFLNLAQTAVNEEGNPILDEMGNPTKSVKPLESALRKYVVKKIRKNQNFELFYKLSNYDLQEKVLHQVIDLTDFSSFRKSLEFVRALVLENTGHESFVQSLQALHELKLEETEVADKLIIQLLQNRFTEISHEKWAEYLHTACGFNLDLMKIIFDAAGPENIQLLCAVQYGPLGNTLLHTAATYCSDTAFIKMILELPDAQQLLTLENSLHKTALETAQMMKQEDNIKAIQEALQQLTPR